MHVFGYLIQKGEQKYKQKLHRCDENWIKHCEARAWLCNESEFRKWLREAKSLLFTLFGVSPVSCSVFGKCAVCVWFIKLLTVIYATFVHTIITGISEFFFCSTPTPESRAWILFINHSRYHFNDEKKKHIHNPRIQDAYQFIIEPIHWKWCIHIPKKTRSKTRFYHRNGKLIKFTARKVNWTTQQKRIDDSAWPCQCKGKYIRALVFNFPFLCPFFIPSLSPFAWNFVCI